MYLLKIVKQTEKQLTKKKVYVSKCERVYHWSFSVRLLVKFILVSILHSVVHPNPAPVSHIINLWLSSGWVENKPNCSQTYNTPAVFRKLPAYCPTSTVYSLLSAFLCNSDSPNNGSGNMIKMTTSQGQKEYFKVILGYRIIVCNCLFCASASN